MTCDLYDETFRSWHAIKKETAVKFFVEFYSSFYYNINVNTY